MNINLHIDRLILEGLTVGPGHKRALQMALQTELAQLIAGSGLSPALSRGGAISDTTVPAIHFVDQRSPTQLGTQIAQSVHQGLVNDAIAKR